MLDEETVKIVAMLQNNSIELFFKLLFKMLDREKQRNMYGTKKKKKKPKVKTGELSEREYSKMLKNGEKFRLIEVPKEKLNEIEQYGKQLGASYYVMDGDEKAALIAVSEKSFQQFDDAIKQTVKSQLSADKESVELMDGNNLISAEQTQLAEEILAAHDIPVYTFLNKDGSCMNVVSKEYSGQYKAAMQEVKDISESVKSVKVTAFYQPESGILSDTRVKAISEKEAQILAKNFGQDKIEFYKSENNIFVKYPAEFKDGVENVLNMSTETQNLLKGFETAVVSESRDYVTIDKKSLDVIEIGTDYFMKIPGTMGQEYLKLPQTDCIEINDGKTLKYSFDKEKQYDILNSDGIILRTVSKTEVEQHYDQKNKKLFGDNNTQTVHYDVSGGSHIEIYDKSKDKLISVGTDSADKLNSILLENGIDSRTAEAITEKINGELGRIDSKKKKKKKKRKKKKKCKNEKNKFAKYEKIN